MSLHLVHEDDWTVASTAKSRNTPVSDRLIGR